MTKLADAKTIVGSEELWVSVDEDLFEADMLDLDWNSMLMMTGIKLPTKSVKIGLLTEVLRKGKVCRPVGTYIDYENQPIAVVKGY